MALDFPASPSNLDTYSVNNVIYVYNETKNAWLLANSNVSISTTFVSEGENLYFTNDRVYSNVAQAGYASTGKAIAMSIVFGG